MKFEEFLPEALASARSRSGTPRGRQSLNLLSWLLDGDGGGLRVEEAAGVGTARLRQASNGAVIEVDPAFVEEQVAEGDSALHLLCHEILHRVRGDLSRFVHLDFCTRTLLGLALDMFVDAQLERMWFDGEGAPYLQRVYKAHAFPEMLLLPPVVLLRQHGIPDATDRLSLDAVTGRFETSRTNRSLLHEALKDALARVGVRKPAAVAELYLHAWLDTMGFAEFWPRFCDAMNEELPLILGNVPLLIGDHDLRDIEWTADGRIVAHVCGTFGGHGRFLRVQNVTLDEDEPDPSPLFAALRLAMDSDPQHPVTRQQLAAERSVVGRMGRPEALSLALGHAPLFWTAQLDQDIEDDQRVQLYLDGSGSMNDQLPFLLGICTALEEHVGDRIHVFSNQVCTAQMNDVAVGRYETTGGTDFDCVVDHALQKRYRRILVLTDGFARLDKGLAGRASSARLEVYVVLFGHWLDRESDICDMAKQVWEWTPSSGGGDSDIPF